MMAMDKEERERREREFIVGLANLTRETGITIGGCGCCGSPYLDEAVRDDAGLIDARAGYGYGYVGEVEWISPEDEHKWAKFGASIVRIGG